MKRAFVKINTIVLVLAAAFSGHAVEESTWGKIKAQVGEEDSAAKRVVITRARNKYQPLRPKPQNMCDKSLVLSPSNQTVSATQGWGRWGCSELKVDLTVLPHVHASSVDIGGSFVNNYAPKNIIVFQWIILQKKDANGQFNTQAVIALDHKWVDDDSGDLFNQHGWVTNVVYGDWGDFHLAPSTSTEQYRVRTRAYNKYDSNQRFQAKMEASYYFAPQ